uniref:Uncharacterized protein n=1 Tax=Anguilla anguilla TaxID=7936 RepID=A0A0E9VW50_ANGAN
MLTRFTSVFMFSKLTVSQYRLQKTL